MSDNNRSAQKSEVQDLRFEGRAWHLSDVRKKRSCFISRGKQLKDQLFCTQLMEMSHGDRGAFSFPIERNWSFFNS